MRMPNAFQSTYNINITSRISSYISPPLHSSVYQSQASSELFSAQPYFYSICICNIVDSDIEFFLRQNIEKKSCIRKPVVPWKKNIERP